MAWADATHLEVLGSLDGATLRPYEVSVDGWRVSDIEAAPGPGQAVAIAAAPPLGDTPLVAGTSDGGRQAGSSPRAAAGRSSDRAPSRPYPG